MEKLRIDTHHSPESNMGWISINDFFKTGFPRITISVEGRNIIHERNEISVNFGTGEIAEKNTNETPWEVSKERIDGLAEQLERVYRQFVETVQVIIKTELEA